MSRTPYPITLEAPSVVLIDKTYLSTIENDQKTLDKLLTKIYPSEYALKVSQRPTRADHIAGNIIRNQEASGLTHDDAREIITQAFTNWTKTNTPTKDLPPLNVLLAYCDVFVTFNVTMITKLGFLNKIVTEPGTITGTLSALLLIADGSLFTHILEAYYMEWGVDYRIAFNNGLIEDQYAPEYIPYHRVTLEEAVDNRALFVMRTGKYKLYNQNDAVVQPGKTFIPEIDQWLERLTDEMVTEPSMLPDSIYLSALHSSHTVINPIAQSERDRLVELISTILKNERINWPISAFIPNIERDVNRLADRLEEYIRVDGANVIAQHYDKITRQIPK